MNTDRAIVQRIIQKVADANGLGYFVVDDIHKSIWEYTKRATELPEYPDIHLNNFGTIRVSVQRLRRIILGAITKYKRGTLKRDAARVIVQRTWPIYKIKWAHVIEAKRQGKKNNLR